MEEGFELRPLVFPVGSRQPPCCQTRKWHTYPGQWPGENMRVCVCVRVCTHTHAHTICFSRTSPRMQVESARRETGPLRARAVRCGAPGSEAGAQASVPAGSQCPGWCVVHFPLFLPQPSWLPQARAGARPSPRAGGPLVEPRDVAEVTPPRGTEPLFPRGDTHLSAPASCFQNRKIAHTSSQEKQELPPPWPGIVLA